MSDSLKVGLVTGGASGLGRAIATRLALAGYRVAIFDVNRELGERVAQETGGRFYSIDVSSAGQWAEGMRAVGEEMGAPVRVFLNAGIMTRPPDSPIDDDIWPWIESGRYEKLMRINVDGALFGMRAVIPGMAAAGGGSITVTSSTAGLGPLPWDPFYSMSKHAVLGMVRSFATNLAEQGIRLNAFCPGGMQTAILPTALADLSVMMMGADDAAQSCCAVAEMDSYGAIWVRTSPDSPLHEYAAPAL